MLSVLSQTKVLLEKTLWQTGLWFKGFSSSIPSTIGQHRSKNRVLGHSSDISAGLHGELHNMIVSLRDYMFSKC